MTWKSKAAPNFPLPPRFLFSSLFIFVVPRIFAGVARRGCLISPLAFTFSLGFAFASKILHPAASRIDTSVLERESERETQRGYISPSLFLSLFLSVSHSTRPWHRPWSQGKTLSSRVNPVKAKLKTPCRTKFFGNSLDNSGQKRDYPLELPRGGLTLGSLTNLSANGDAPFVPVLGWMSRSWKIVSIVRSGGLLQWTFLIYYPGRFSLGSSVQV